MDARRTIFFLKANWKSIALGLFVIVAALALWLQPSDRQKAKGRAVDLTQNASDASKASINRIQTAIPQFVQPNTRKEEEVIAPPPPQITNAPFIPPLPIVLYQAPPSQRNISPQSAPFGRLVKCKLVNTIDSSKLNTPIIAIVTHDVINPGGDGTVVIPAGTEVHGFGQQDRTRDRIASQNNWTLVWTDGSKRELSVSGVALDMAFDPNGQGWDITDGSAGMRGSIEEFDRLAELKLILAQFVSGLAEGAIDQTVISRDNALGTSTTTRREGSIQNAIALGAQNAVQQYTESLMKKLEAEASFVRVAAGSTFYLYVTQPIDAFQATIAGSIPLKPQGTGLP